jgi:hypothetical protein
MSKERKGTVLVMVMMINQTYFAKGSRFNNPVSQGGQALLAKPH